MGLENPVTIEYVMEMEHQIKRALDAVQELKDGLAAAEAKIDRLRYPGRF